MIKLKKGVLAYLAAAVLIASAFAGVFALFKTNAAHAETTRPYVLTGGLNEKIPTVGEELLAIDGTTLTGFTDPTRLPVKCVLRIPDAVTAIAEGAFADMNRIVRVELPAHPVAIGDNAFRGCTGVVEVVNPAETGITPPERAEDKYYLFYYAVSIIQSASETNLTLVDNDFIFCETDAGNYLVGYAGDGRVTLPAYGGEEYIIHDYAFWSENGNSVESEDGAGGIDYATKSTDITSVTFADGAAPLIKTVGNYAFALNKNLITVKLPDTVTSIGVSAFQRCDNLTYINVPENIETINDYAFSECINLRGCDENVPFVFPANLKTVSDEAFFGCTALDSIEFEEKEGFVKTGVIDNADGLTIERGAFRNCSALSALTLPQHLATLYNNAFVGCTALRYAYLPDYVKYEAVVAGGEIALYFDMNTWLVFPCYEAASDSHIPMFSPIMNHSDKFTYIVIVNFDDGHQTFEPYERLWDRPYNLIKDVDGNWSVVSNAPLFPVQDGYSKSVWYLDEGCTQKANVENLTKLMRDVGASGLSEVTLYAHYVEKPEFETQNVTYSPSAIISWQNFVPESYRGLLENGAFVVDFNGQTVINAGGYTLRVSLNQSDYGAWSEPVIKNITVTPAPINLASDIGWVTGGSLLSGGTVNEFRNGSDVLYSQLGEIPGYAKSAVYNVNNAIARYTGGEIVQIGVAPNAGYAAAVGAVYFGGEHFEGVVQANEIGRYEVYALLTVNPNYSFTNTGGTADNIRISSDGVQALVRKTWYLLDSPNPLFTGDDKTTYYKITGWTYNDADSFTAPAAPVPNVISENASLSFTLTGTTGYGAVTASDGCANFDKYINFSMPAGEYSVIFHIPEFTSGSVTYYAYDTAPYTFTVGVGEFKDAWKADIAAKFIDVEYAYRAGVMQLYNNGGEFGVDLDIWSASFLGAFNPVNTAAYENSYWRGEALANHFSQSFTVTYNLLGMTTNKYYTHGELRNARDLISPINPGVYTVYYQFTALNYAPFTDTADDTARRAHTFKVTIYDEIALPVVGDITYAEGGSSLYVEPSEYYSIEYVGCKDNNPVYAAVGKYTVRFTLGNSEIHRWQGSQGSKNAVKDVEFRVNRAQNTPSIALSMVQWSYGSYSAEANSPVWAVYYEDKTDRNFYSFRLVAENGDVYIYGDGEKGFDKAPNGAYTLVATAKETANWLEARAEISVYITKGVNSWLTTPSIMQWSYNNFDINKNTLSAEALIHSEAKHVIFSITRDTKGADNVCESFYVTDGKVSESVANALNKLKARTYYLWAEVKETSLYSGIPKSYVPFEVTKANNYWEEAPAIESWIVGRYDEEANVVKAKSRFGTDFKYIITSADDESVVIYDAENGINDLAKAKVGLYVLKVSVDGTDDYEGIEDYTFLFNVFEKAGMPWWGTLLIVLGVVAVLAIILYILHQKGILQLLTGKMIIAIRTRVTVDATIAAVRAHKLTEQSNKSIRRSSLQEANEARRRKKEEMANMSLEEQAAALDEKARETAEKAEKLDRRATRMQKRANKLKKELSKQSDENGADGNQNAQNPENQG